MTSQILQLLGGADTIHVLINHYTRVPHGMTDEHDTFTHNQPDEEWTNNNTTGNNTRSTTTTTTIAIPE
eukprot:8987083-Prorocentrum_lima.AAC.1